MCNSVIVSSINFWVRYWALRRLQDILMMCNPSQCSSQTRLIHCKFCMRYGCSGLAMERSAPPFTDAINPADWTHLNVTVTHLRILVDSSVCRSRIDSESRNTSLEVRWIREWDEQFSDKSSLPDHVLPNLDINLLNISRPPESPNNFGCVLTSSGDE